MPMNHDVTLAWTEERYPPTGPSDGDGPIHRLLAAMFAASGKDAENPFAGQVSRGERVVLKPNWVLHQNPDCDEIESLVTHTSVIEAVADFAARGLEGEGEIVIGDAPLQSCDFAALCSRAGVDAAVEALRQRWPGIDFFVEDWRLTLLEDMDDAAHAVTAHQRQRSDYAERVDDRYRLVDRGRESFLEDTADYADGYRVTCYKPSMMSAHHRPGTHEYLVTRRIFDADLFINLPKMKTHMKAGLTGALKNLVGINGHKEYLPHHIKGGYFDGGDGYARSDRFRRMHDDLYDYAWENQQEHSPRRRRTLEFLMKTVWRLSRLTGDSISEAGWSGNDTIWRTTLDLNHVLFFSEESPRHLLSIADGIIAGEGQGPLRPIAKPAGLLLMGENPAYVDAVIGRLMGYNLSRIPTVHNAIYDRRSRFAGPLLDAYEVTTLARDGAVGRAPLASLPNLDFRKPRHWERAESGEAVRAA